MLIKPSINDYTFDELLELCKELTPENINLKFVLKVIDEQLAKDRRENETRMSWGCGKENCPYD